MQRTNRSLTTLLAAASLGMLGTSPAPTAAPADSQPSVTQGGKTLQSKALRVAVDAPQHLMTNWGNLTWRSRRPPGYPRGGWSVRQGQRMARKARNVARNRRAHRG